MVSCVYDFRCNEENFKDYDDLHTFLSTKCKKWVFQLEQGEKTGYRHYQGRLNLIKKTTKSNVLKLTDNKFNYLEPTISKEHLKEAFYCLKEQTRLKEPESDIDYNKRKNVFIPKHLKAITYETLRPFQKTIHDHISNDREINVVYCPKGKMGKSIISQYMEIHKKGFRCPTLNDYKDILQLLCCYCRDNEIRDIGHLFFDFPRAQCKDSLNGIISAIEEIKSSGRLIDIRNHFKIWNIESPNIWVFTNEMPPIDSLSADRWNIWTIDENYELKPYKEKKNLDIDYIECPPNLHIERKFTPANAKPLKKLLKRL